MISVVCIYNDESIFRAWLLKNLQNQTVEFELIKLDNSRAIFKSAAEALNHAGKEARGKYIMFVHQDVDLCSNRWLEEAEKILDGIPDLGIAGVMGICEAGASVRERMRNIIKHGDDQRQIGNFIDTPTHVQTLDELLLIIPKDIFEKYEFDPKACDGWHLYGVDYCLTVANNGLGVYAIPMFAQHMSEGASLRKPLFSLPVMLNLGPLTRDYYRALKNVLRKHRNNYRWIYTTCGHGKWNTYEPLILQRALHLVREYSKSVWKRIKKAFKIK